MSEGRARMEPQARARARAAGAPPAAARRLRVTGVTVDAVDLDGAAQAVAALVERGRRMLGRDGAGGRAGTVACAGGAGGAGGAGAGRGAGEGIGAWPGMATVCTPNAEIMMEAQRDPELRGILNAADLLLPDGMGVVVAARILGLGRIARTPGFDLVRKLLEERGRYPYSYFLLGGKPGVADEAARNILARYPGARVAGTNDGYFTEDGEPELIGRINASGADVLLVALGAPKQEKWMSRRRAALRVPLGAGVGGTLDILAGAATLTPDFFRRHGLEWMYRLYKEPWRARRMLRLPQYMALAALWRLTGRAGQ